MSKTLHLRSLFHNDQNQQIVATIDSVTKVKDEKDTYKATMTLENDQGECEETFVSANGTTPEKGEKWTFTGRNEDDAVVSGTRNN